MDGAKYYFQRTLDINNEDIYAHFYLGNILKEQGDVSGAIEQFYNVLDISPDYSWAYFNLASIDYEQGNFDGVVENLEKTLEFNSKDTEAYKIYIKILIKENLLEDAANIANRAIENCPNEGDLYYILAQVQKHRHINDEYVKNMTEAIKHSKTLTISPKIIKEEMDNFIKTSK